MEQKLKDSLKLILDLYKTDRLDEEGAFMLLETIFNTQKTTYYPITIPNEPQPWKNPWDNQPWYIGEPYVHYTTTTTNKIKEENE